MSDIQLCGDELLRFIQASLFLEDIAERSFAIRTSDDFAVLHRELHAFVVPDTLKRTKQAIGINMFKIAESRCQDSIMENDIAKWFEDNLAKIFPEATIVSFDVIPGHIPDFMICIHGKNLPVEIKRNAFNKRALKQLQRYINVYKTKGGIAVAPRLNCNLPPHMRFVKAAL